MKKALVLVIGLLFFGDNAYAANGDLVVNGNLTVGGTVNGAATKLTDGTNLIHTKIIDIGYWDMDAVDHVDVFHNLDYYKIRTITVLVRSNLDRLYDINFTGTAGTGYQGIEVDDASIVTIRRKTGGFFDSPDFNYTTYNRGWVTITYVE